MKKTIAVLSIVLALISMLAGCTDVISKPPLGGTGVKPDDVTGVKPGDKAKENITIAGTTYLKTDEVYVVPAGTTKTITGSDVKGTFFAEVFQTGRNVTLSGFIMSKYAVTQELYEAVMTGNNNSVSATPSRFKTGAAAGETQNLRPVEQVSWYDAIVFCNKLSVAAGLDPVYSLPSSSATDKTDVSRWGAVPTSISISMPWDAITMDMAKNGYRLPTEAEWEYAARYTGGTLTPTGCLSGASAPYTDEEVSGAVAWYDPNARSKTHEVGLKAANALGLFDMSGNVWEWCWDREEPIATGSVSDPTGAVSSGKRVNRGGDWFRDVSYCRIAFRFCASSFVRDPYQGFRLVRSAK